MANKKPFGQKVEFNRGVFISLIVAIILLALEAFRKSAEWISDQMGLSAKIAYIEGLALAAIILLILAKKYHKLVEN